MADAARDAGGLVLSAGRDAVGGRARGRAPGLITDAHPFPAACRVPNSAKRLSVVQRPKNPLRATTINDFAKLGTALGGTPTIVERLPSRATSFGMAVGAEDTLGVLRD